MNKRSPTLAAALMLALATFACGSLSPIQTGPTETRPITLPMPAARSGVELNLEFASGDLKVSPGATKSLLTGSATFNVAGLEPVVETSGTSYTVRQSAAQLKGIPDPRSGVHNAWDLQLADTPISLRLQAGAYNGTFELGGLSLEELAITEGGSTLTAAFSQPNHVPMSSFSYTSGGSTVELRGLANANFERMTYSTGAGTAILSFDGRLQRDASVTIDAGAGTVTLIVPQGVNARVTVDGKGLSSTNVEGAWQQDGTTYTLPGTGPLLSITVKIGAGTLNLKTQ